MKVDLGDAAGVLPNAPTLLPVPSLPHHLAFWMAAIHTSALLHLRAECRWAVNAWAVHPPPKKHESRKVKYPGFLTLHSFLEGPLGSELSCPQWKSSYQHFYWLSFISYLISLLLYNASQGPVQIKPI